MTAGFDSLQRIDRLTPLREVLARITTSLSPVTPMEVKLADALGHVAAGDVGVAEPVPAVPLALYDGYAVRAEATADASAYAPVLLGEAHAVDAGQPLPPGADAVVTLESVMTDAAGVHAVAVATRGEGVAPTGFDVRLGEPVQVAGTQLRHVDLAVLAAVGVSRIAVRAPSVRVLAAREDPIVRQVVALIERLACVVGGEIVPTGAAGLAALTAGDAQMTVVVGGSGSGRDDRSVQTLARVGRVDVHGIAIGPGQTSAIGAVNGTPVLVLPGRIDGALAAWLTVGVPMMRRITGSTEERPTMFVTLTRKVTSTVGLLEFVPVRLHEGKALPLASGYLPLHALSQANAYILVPAESEGYPEGAVVGARLIP